MAIKLIVTADDFGRSVEINEAVEQAHRQGILTSASLMVSGAAAEDAIMRAKRLPRLAVGLHLALVDAVPVCDPDEVPTLTGKSRTLRSGTVTTGMVHFIHPAARREIRHEIAAQFRAFEATGLDLDHVDAHHHYHLHPTVGAELLRIGSDFGLSAVRLPVEPGGEMPGTPMALRPCIALLRHRLDKRGIRRNDLLFGVSWSGEMTPPRVCRILSRMPPGLHEIYFHPVIGQAHANADLTALTDPEVMAAIKQNGISLTTYSAQ